MDHDRDLVSVMQSSEPLNSDASSVSVKKPNGYWRNRDNFDAEVRAFADEIGHFPSNSDLIRAGRETISTSASKYHGGLLETRRRLGYSMEGLSRPENYWKDFDNVLEAIKNIWQKNPEQNGKLPSAWWMQKNGFSGLPTVIVAYHGGFPKVRKRIGDLRETVAPLKTFSEIKAALEEVWQKHPEQNGKLPPDNWLREHGFSRIGYSVYQYHGSFGELRKKLGDKPLRPFENVDLTRFENLKQQIEKVQSEHPEQNGKLPGGHWLMIHGYHAVAKAIYDHHSGFPEVRKRLGYAEVRAANGFFNDIENVNKELNKILSSHPEFEGKLPSVNWLQNNGYGGLYASIAKSHGGYNKLRASWGQEKKLITKEQWQDPSFVIEMAKKMQAENGWVILPGGWSLAKVKYGPALRQAIVQYHGGLSKFRELMGQKNPINSRDEFKQELNRDTSLAMLSGATLMLNGEGDGVEEVIMGLHPGRFRSRKQLHSYLVESRDAVIEAVNKGLTNLGAFIGEFSLTDRYILPVLLGEGLNGVGAEKVSGPLEDRVVRTLQYAYSPRFNSNPGEVMQELEMKLTGSSGPVQKVYAKLKQHYQETARLQEALS